MFNFQRARESVICKDGFAMSVQASENHYCSPRESGCSVLYSSVEVGFPNRIEFLLKDHIDTFYDDDVDKRTRAHWCNSIYVYVPAYVIIDIITKHGGMVEGQLPELDLTNYDEEE